MKFAQKGLIYTIISLTILLIASCSRPSRDNDDFISRAPSEFRDHYEFIDRYRTMYPYKLDSTLQLLDNRYENDSSSIESAYYNLAFAYKEYSTRHYKNTLFRLFRAENALISKEFPAFKAEIKLLAAMSYKNLAFNIFAKTHFKEAYDYFKDGDYPNQTMLAAFNLAWLESSDSLKGSSDRVKSYTKLCDSIFINNHDKIEYVNYYYYKYLIDKPSINYYDSLLKNIDIAQEPSIGINRLYHMNINLTIDFIKSHEFDRARVIVDRSDSIYSLENDKVETRLRSYHLFNKAIVLVEEGHPEAALEIYKEGAEIRETVLSDVRIDLSKYRALYDIYYEIGTTAQIDSAWLCHKNASDSLLYRQNRDGVTSLLRYKDLAMRRNEQILKTNKYHYYIRCILIIIGLISLAYIARCIKINREIKRDAKEASRYEEKLHQYKELVRKYKEISRYHGEDSIYDSEEDYTI